MFIKTNVQNDQTKEKNRMRTMIKPKKRIDHENNDQTKENNRMRTMIKPKKIIKWEQWSNQRI